MTNNMALRQRLIDCASLSFGIIEKASIIFALFLKVALLA